MDEYKRIETKVLSKVLSKPNHNSSSAAKQISETDGINWNLSIPEIFRVIFHVNSDKDLSNLCLKMKKVGVESQEEAQNYINWFSFEMQVNNLLTQRNIKNPLAYFLACLEKGYSKPHDFKSDEETAAEEMLGRQKKQLEIKSKFKEEVFLTEFNLWTETLSEAEKKSMMPKDFPCEFMGVFHVSSMKEFFTENKWSTVWDKYNAKH
jgi:hypothetical protein